MVKLNVNELKKHEAWAACDIKIPTYDVDKMKDHTRKHPMWVHIGPGNIFRGFIADLANGLLEAGEMKSGITVVSTFDQQIISKIYESCDSLALRVVMTADGRFVKNVVASIGEVLRTDKEFPTEWGRSLEVFRSPELQMVSFTITEKGYSIRDLQGDFYPAAVRAFSDLSDDAVLQNGMSIIARLLLERFRAGAYPIAMVSMDNFSHNGDRLLASVLAFAEKWAENGLVPKEFVSYINDGKNVTFPWSMIDKITPRPDAEVARKLRETGFESTELIITDKNTYISPFVNTEGPQYLVIEDAFPNGRPPLEKVGVRFCARETVDLVERMKVCTCLNPLHTAMAVFGSILGYKSISAEMKDASIVKLIKRIGYVEGMPVVAAPKIFAPMEFINEVISERLPNPYIPDTPQRIATDTSQKIPIRYGETIKRYAASGNLDINSLKAIPLVIAAWCRYLLAVDDEGAPLELSPDPLAGELREYLRGIKFNEPETAGDKLRPILSNKTIFGSDLYEVGLAQKVNSYFKRMLQGKGAVRRTLDEETSAVGYCGNN